MFIYKPHSTPLCISDIMGIKFYEHFAERHLTITIILNFHIFQFLSTREALQINRNDAACRSTEFALCQQK